MPLKYFASFIISQQEKTDRKAGEKMLVEACTVASIDEENVEGDIQPQQPLVSTETADTIATSASDGNPPASSPGNPSGEWLVRSLIFLHAHGTRLGFLII